MRRQPVASAIGETHTKPRATCHVTLPRVAVTNNTNRGRAGWRDSSHRQCWRKWEMTETLWECLEIPQKVRESPLDVTILILGLHSRAQKKHVHAKTCPQVFVATLFIEAKKMESPKCQQLVRAIPTVEYYSALERSGALRHTTPWADLETPCLVE